jgi:WD40 repeat protein
MTTELSSIVPSPTNPYVGPRPFETSDQGFFVGRDEEIKILEGQVMSRRASLLFAQSGAGKTSLLRAGLIPELTRPLEVGRGQRKRVEQKMGVLPILTVGGAQSRLPPTVANPFLLNALSKLLPNAGLTELAGLSLRAALDTHFAEQVVDERGSPRTTLLIVDQFEELFTHYLDHWPHREDFFRQVEASLSVYPTLHVLFSMREDFIGELTPYASLLPDQLRARFRLERLKRGAAIQAVMTPASRAGRTFPRAVAEELVDNLRRTQAGKSQRQPGASGALAPVLSDYVEPVHLQIVCRDLWEKLPAERTVIQAEDVVELLDVDQALMHFYNTTLEQVAQQTSLSQRRLRAWFGEKLITPAHTRSLVYRDETVSEELPNVAVDLFNQAWLIRAEVRGGDAWYQLTHDRLVEPILAANAAWLTSYDNPLTAPTQEWLRNGRAPAQLLREEALAVAQRYAQEQPHELLTEEQELLAASLERQRQVEQQARERAAWRRNLAIAAVVVMLLLVALSLWALDNAARAREQEATAETNAILAVEARNTAEARKREADLLRIEAEQQARIAHSRQLAAQAQTQLGDQLDLALLLALEANRITTTVEARGSLLMALQQTPALITYLRGHRGRVWGVAYQPQGEWLATGAEDGDVLLWNPHSGQRLPVAPLVNRAGYVRALAVDPQGRLLASGHRNGAITLWGMSSLPPESTIVTLHSSQINQLAFDAESRTLASAARDGLGLTDLTKLGEGGESKLVNQAPTSSVAYSSNGQWQAVGRDDGQLILINLTTSQTMTLTKGSEAIAGLAFGPDSQHLAASAGAAIQVWDLATRQPFTLSGHTALVQSLAFSPAGELLVSGSRDGSVRRWSLRNRALVGERLVNRSAPYTSRSYRFAREPSVSEQLVNTSDWVVSVAFRPDGQQIASGSANQSVTLWQVDDAPRLAHPLAGHTDEVWTVGFSPDGRWLASGSKDHQVVLWEVQSGRAITLSDHTAEVRTVAFDPTGALLATGDESGELRLWLANNPAATPTRFIQNAGVKIGSVAFSRDGTTLAVGDFARQIVLWNLRVGQPVSTLLGIHDGQIWSVAFSADGRQLLAGDDSGVAKMWDVTNRRAQGSFSYELPLQSVALSPDGRYVAGGSADSNVILWDAQTGARLALLAQHTDRVLNLVFSPDSQTLASASFDQQVILWDVPTRRMIGAPLVGHTAPVNGLAFRPDGRSLASAGDDRLVLLWDIDLSSWYGRACQIANRNLTVDEWSLYLGDELNSIACPER